MSTRSGKRIHNSLNEDTGKKAGTDDTTIIKPEKKTRSRRLKENINEDAGDVKKKHNYVAYPGDDVELDATTELPTETKQRKVRKNTLKDHNINDAFSHTTQEIIVPKKKGRLTRQTKIYNEFQAVESEDTISTDVSNKKNRRLHNNNGELGLKETTDTGMEKPKKNKKKKKVEQKEQNDDEEIEIPVEAKKKGKKKKSSKKSGSISKQDIISKKNSSLNKSGMSVDSFHSAAGSPVSLTNNGSRDIPLNSPKEIFIATNQDDLENEIIHTTKRKSSIKVVTPRKTSKDSVDQARPLSNINTEVLEQCNTTLEKKNGCVARLSQKRKSSMRDDLTEANNETFDKSKKSSLANEIINSLDTDCNLTFEKKDNTLETSNSAKKCRRSRRLSHLDPEAPPDLTVNRTSDKNKVNSLDLTFEKPDSKLDSTFDKTDDKVTKETKADTTFDKTDEKTSSKSSLMTSDGELNGTYNRTKDISSISITSDDSKTENIINTTPVLIESSLDATQIEETPVKPDSPIATVPITPLKREGTFTKESPENTTSPLPVITDSKTNFLNKTPDKRMSVGTPGSTPFPFSKGPQKKSVLNVTRSIEKGTRRSTLSDYAPRNTKVMFCSPVDFPPPNTEKKRMIVKSSMKGSNKSFVFDESASTAGRKRSRTEEAGCRAKRSRLDPELRDSVDRLSRPRTSSAAAKLSSTTPTKKTPVKPRTKLPNFAALHRRQFEQMESLDECQRRRARRAKQLMTATGGVSVLERGSPKATDSPRKSKEPSAKKAEQAKESAKKTDTKDNPKKNQKSKGTSSKKLEMSGTHKTSEKPDLETALLTLGSMRSGYTRFGFKMDIGISNPFSIPPKQPSTVIKSQDKKPITTKTRITLPSAAGTTTVRKEAAKQIVMREKSFSNLSNIRNSKRTENRTIIKGVRTNRRFELQMKMRNVDG